LERIYTTIIYLLISTCKQTFEMKFEIHFEFRASLRKFQDLNFWDATMALPNLDRSQPVVEVRSSHVKRASPKPYS
jgi:hypothetical protein